MEWWKTWMEERLSNLPLLEWIKVLILWSVFWTVPSKYLFLSKFLCFFSVHFLLSFIPAYLPCTDLFPFPLKVIIYHIYENYLSVKSTLPRPKNIPVCRWFELFAFLNTKKNRSVFNFFCFKGVIMHCHFPRQRKFEFKSGRDRKTDMHTKTTMLICFQNFRIFSLVVERSLDDSYITIFFCCVEPCF